MWEEVPPQEEGGGRGGVEWVEVRVSQAIGIDVYPLCLLCLRRGSSSLRWCVESTVREGGFGHALGAAACLRAPTQQSGEKSLSGSILPLYHHHRRPHCHDSSTSQPPITLIVIITVTVTITSMTTEDHHQPPSTARGLQPEPPVHRSSTK